MKDTRKIQSDFPENDDLWDLLGKAESPQPSPFFSRNVIREVRQLGQPPVNSLWKRMWRPLAGATAACALVFVGMSVSSSYLGRSLTASNATTIDQDFEIIANLDELLAYEENTLWLDQLPN